MAILRLLSILVSLLIVLACGGGGGGGGGAVVPNSALLYTTDWTLRGSPGGGQSQRLTLMDGNGKTVKVFAVERHSVASEMVRIENVAAGTYLLQVELFSQPLLSGVMTGLIQIPITVNGETQFQTAVGTSPASVKVFPETAEAQVPESRKFYGVARSAAGVFTFNTPGSFAWQAFGGVGTINASGVLLTTQAGNGSVRATLNGLNGAATVQVAPASIRQSKWTVLVYLNAANDLYSFSELNMDQIERASTNADVRFVVQWKQARNLFSDSSFDGTRRYLTRNLIQDLGGGIDMGKPDTLKQFVDWAKTYYPAQRYALVVWNHGNGWRRRPENSRTRAVSYDDETGNAIQIWDLATALGTHHFDLIAWDASLMQMMEVAYEVRARTDYVIGSEESPPGEGYPYDTIFARFAQNPDDTTRNLSKAFVDGTLAVPGYATRKITQSVIETSKLGALERSIDALAGKFMSSPGVYTSAIQQVRNESQSYSQTTSRYYRDLSDMCTRFEALTDLDPFCADIRAKLAAAVVWEGHNAQSPGSSGLSIDMTPGNRFLPNAADYGRMQFARVNRWDNWLAVSP